MLATHAGREADDASYICILISLWRTRLEHPFSTRPCRCDFIAGAKDKRLGRAAGIEDVDVETLRSCDNIGVDV
jgi:hypothetical protein